MRGLGLRWSPLLVLLAVSQFSMEQAFEAQQYVSLAAPVIGRVARTILNHPNTNIAKIQGLGVSCTRLTFVDYAFYLSPICQYKGNS